MELGARGSARKREHRPDLAVRAFGGCWAPRFAFRAIGECFGTFLSQGSAQARETVKAIPRVRRQRSAGDSARVYVWCHGSMRLLDLVCQVKQLGRRALIDDSDRDEKPDDANACSLILPRREGRQRSLNSGYRGKGPDGS